MTDLSIQSTPAPATADHTWLAGDATAFATAQSGTIQVSSLTSGTHYDAATKVVPAGLAVSKVGDFFVPYGGASEVQTVTIGGGATGGTFTITFDGQTTAAIAFGATASAVQTALEALSNVNPGDVVVSGTSPAYTLSFGGQYTGKNVPQVTASAGSLTGGTPTITPATTQAGGSTVAGADVLDGFTAYPIPLLLANGSLSTVVIFARLIEAAIIPANLPVPAQRSINQLTPSRGSFAFVI
jgi:hypothetical protein